MELVNLMILKRENTAIMSSTDVNENEVVLEVSIYTIHNKDVNLRNSKTYQTIPNFEVFSTLSHTLYSKSGISRR